MRMNKWLKNNTSDLTGKRVAISGSTGGLGEAVCFHLAKLGASFIFLNRNLEKSKKLEEKLKENFPNCQVQHIKTDMGDMQSVKNACKELQKLNFDYLILNAGAYKVENTFQINFLAPFYLASSCKNVKVVAVGSIAHKNVRIDKTYKKDMQIYGLSKRFLMFSLTELFKEGNFAIAHPGITYTNITSQYPKFLIPFIKFFMKIIFPSTQKASLCIVKAVFDNSEYGTWIGPKYFDIWGYPKHKKLKTFSATESQKALEIAKEKVEI